MRGNIRRIIHDDYDDYICKEDNLQHCRYIRKFEQLLLFSAIIALMGL